MWIINQQDPTLTGNDVVGLQDSIFYWIQPNPRENYFHVHEWKINAWFSIDMTMMGGNSIHTGMFGRRVDSEESTFFLCEVKFWKVITTRDLCRNNEEKFAQIEYSLLLLYYEVLILPLYLDQQMRMMVKILQQYLQQQQIFATWQEGANYQQKQIIMYVGLA